MEKLLVTSDGYTAHTYAPRSYIYVQLSAEGKDASPIELFEPYGFISVYICPQSSVETGGKIFVPNELRLMRRIVRDYNFRNADAEFTMHLWESVRQNEEKNIFPYADACVYKIDSSKPYEIGVLKPYLEKILGVIPPDSPYYKASRQILEKISDIQPISSDLIGEDSLYKEFV